MNELTPLDVRIDSVALQASASSFKPDIAREGKRTAQVSFGVTPALRDNNNLLVLTTYRVTLENPSGQVFAEVSTEFLALLSSREDLPEPLDSLYEARVELAAAEATHFHHRSLIARLTGDAGLRPYNLPTAFRREEFAATLQPSGFDASNTATGKRASPDE